MFYTGSFKQTESGLFVQVTDEAKRTPKHGLFKRVLVKLLGLMS